VLLARVVTAAVLLAAFVAALFLLPRSWWAILVGLILFAAGWEWARLCRLGAIPAGFYAAGVAALFGLGYLLNEEVRRAAFVVATLFWAAVAPLWLARGVRSRHRPALIAAGVVVLVPAGIALAVLEAKQVLFALVLVWIADTGAYFSGRKWGRRKLAPAISPGKTWEGVWGGVAGATAYAIIIGYFHSGPGTAWLVDSVVIAVVLTGISIVGDLFESGAKRQAEVKDSGALLPGHGGVLDRIDSASAVLPLAALLVTLPKP